MVTCFQFAYNFNLRRYIKFAFFQPAKKELKTVIHFHLHNPIMVGKKKTKVGRCSLTL